MRSRVALISSLFIFSGVAAFLNLSAAYCAYELSAVGRKYPPKIESVLGVLEEKYARGREEAEQFARKRGIPFEEDRATVILVPSEGRDSSAIDREALASYGAEILAASTHLVRVSVPVYNLGKVAERVGGISYMRVPMTPHPAGVVSEGVQLTGASLYHQAGYKGQNTKVAVIDLGFSRFRQAQDRGELPQDLVAKDFTGEGMEARTTHGTNVAEILYDMAPEARLHLVKIADEVDLENAKDYCISEGVDVISHSWAWFNTNFTDGTGLVCGIADDASSRGLLWVNAAGNWVDNHYQGFFSDADDNGWHEFAGADETNIIEVSWGDSVYLYLTWDDWPATSQDYDLYLFVRFGSDFVPIADSTTRQTGTQPPIESIAIPNAGANTYYVAIQEYATTEAKELKLFSFSHPLEHRTGAHSLSAPADATGAVAVAAIDYANWESGPQEAYSSQGPTTDGRTKPDIAGPTNVATSTSGRQGGTSGATPHVAGAASLLLCRDPGLSPRQIQATLESWAVDMGGPGKDNVYGSGRLRLLLAEVSLENLIVYPNPCRASAGDTVIVFAGLTHHATIRIFNIAGELVRKEVVTSQSNWSWDLRNMAQEKIARGVYVWLVTNVFGEKRIGKIAIIN